jgi:hypothetical protein
MGSRDSSASIEKAWMAGVLLPAGARDFSLFHGVHTGSGAHPVYSMGTWGSFPGYKVDEARS